MADSNDIINVSTNDINNDINKNTDIINYYTVKNQLCKVTMLTLKALQNSASNRNNDLISKYLLKQGELLTKLYNIGCNLVNHGIIKEENYHQNWEKILKNKNCIANAMNVIYDIY